MQMNKGPLSGQSRTNEEAEEGESLLKAEKRACPLMPTVLFFKIRRPVLRQSFLGAVLVRAPEKQNQQEREREDGW